MFSQKKPKRIHLVLSVITAFSVYSCTRDSATVNSKLNGAIGNLNSARTEAENEFKPDLDSTVLKPVGVSRATGGQVGPSVGGSTLTNNVITPTEPVVPATITVNSQNNISTDTLAAYPPAYAAGGLSLSARTTAFHTASIKGSHICGYWVSRAKAAASAGGDQDIHLMGYVRANHQSGWNLNLTQLNGMPNARAMFMGSSNWPHSLHGAIAANAIPGGAIVNFKLSASGLKANSSLGAHCYEIGGIVTDPGEGDPPQDEEDPRYNPKAADIDQGIMQRFLSGAMSLADLFKLVETGRLSLEQYQILVNMRGEEDDRAPASR